MKKLILSFVALLILSVSALADLDIKRAAAVVTTGYVTSSAITCDDHQITLEVRVSGTPEAVTCSLKPQWSTDNVNWVDEPVSITGTATATEQPYTRLSKRFDFSLNASGIVFSETFNRWGNNRYFRVTLKGGSATTTALVEVGLGVSKIAR